MDTKTPRPIFILALGYHPHPSGGAFRYVRALAEGLVRLGHAVHIFAPLPRGLPATPGFQADVREGVVIHWFPQGRGWRGKAWMLENKSAWKRMANLQQKLQAQEPVLLGTHAFLQPAFDKFTGPKLALFTGPWAEEYVWKAQGFNGLKDRTIAMVMNWVEARWLRGAGRIFTVSDYYQTGLKRWHAGALPEVVNIGGGVELTHFYPLADRDGLRRERGFAGEMFLWIVVRRLEPGLGLEGLMEEIARVAPRFPNARWCFLGSGSLAGDLRKQIGRLGLAAQVVLKGFIPEQELNEWYNAADGSLLTSLDVEGFGWVAAESLAAGTPVLGADTGAIPEILGGLEPQLLCRASEAGALAAKMGEVMSGAGWWPGRGRCAEFAAERFNWSEPVRAISSAVGQITG